MWADKVCFKRGRGVMGVGRQLPLSRVLGMRNITNATWRDFLLLVAFSKACRRDDEVLKPPRRVKTCVKCLVSGR